MELSKVVYSVCAIGSFLSLIAYASFNNPNLTPRNMAPNVSPPRAFMMAPTQGGVFAGADGLLHGQAADGRPMVQDPRSGSWFFDAAEFRAPSSNQNVARTFVGTDGLVYGQMSDGRMIVQDPVTRSWQLVGMQSYAQNYQVSVPTVNYSAAYGGTSYAAPNSAVPTGNSGWWAYNQPNAAMNLPNRSLVQDSSGRWFYAAPNSYANMGYFYAPAAQAPRGNANMPNNNAANYNAVLGSDGRILF